MALLGWGRDPLVLPLQPASAGWSLWWRLPRERLKSPEACSGQKARAHFCPSTGQNRFSGGGARTALRDGRDFSHIIKDTGKERDGGAFFSFFFFCNPSTKLLLVPASSQIPILLRGLEPHHRHLCLVLQPHQVYISPIC